MLSVYKNGSSTVFPYGLRHWPQRNGFHYFVPQTDTFKKRKAGKGEEKDDPEDLLYPIKKAKKDEEKECRTLHYRCKREDFGRLDYNADLANVVVRRLGKSSSLAHLVKEVPTIVTGSHFDFMILLPYGSGQDPDFDFAQQISSEKAEKQQNPCSQDPVIAFGLKENLGKKFNDCDILHLDMEHLSNCQLVSHRLKVFLTEFYEKKIFSFAEMVFRNLDSGYNLRSKDVESKLLQIIRRDVLCLLHRKLPEHDTTADKNESIKKKYISARKSNKRLSALEVGERELESKVAKIQEFKRYEVQGIGNSYNGFTIFIKDPKDWKERDRVSSNIRHILLSNGIKVRPDFVWVSEMNVTKCVGKGDRIENNTEGATVGTFLHKDDQWKIISAGHVFHSGDRVWLDDRSIGTCSISVVQNESDQELVDIALIDLHPGVTCSLYLTNENGKDIEYKARIFRGRVEDLRDVPFHKVGASTHWTNGRYYGKFANGYPLQNIAIQGVEGDDLKPTCFATNGDSGAIVFFYDNTDIKNETIVLVSIISSKTTIEQTSAASDIPQESDVVITASLEKCLKYLKEEKNIPVDSFTIT